MVSESGQLSLLAAGRRRRCPRGGGSLSDSLIVC